MAQPRSAPRVIQAQPAAQYVGASGYGAYGGAVAAPAANPQTLQTVKNLLENREELKTTVIKAFKHVAGTSDRLDISGLIRVRAELAKKFAIPESIFGEIQDEYQRFDFDGS